MGIVVGESIAPAVNSPPAGWNHPLPVSLDLDTEDLNGGCWFPAATLGDSVLLESRLVALYITDSPLLNPEDVSCPHDCFVWGVTLST
jgi:hypothetical protein